MASFKYEEIEVGDEFLRQPCKCCRLDRGIDLPIPKILTKYQIRTLALGFSHSIFADWSALNAILKRFEATVQKRWLKKTHKQRRELLLKAWPGMSQTHRPDFEHFRDLKKKRVARSKTCSSDAFLWPNINLEDLMQGHLLLLFLNSRGRAWPEVFANHDMEAAHLGYGWDEWPIGDEEGMLFRKQHTPRTYGRFCKPGALPKGVGRLERYHPKIGLLCLEIQKGIYAFLLDSAKLLLHDVDQSRFRLAPHQPMPSPIKTSFASWESVTDHKLEAQYRLPQTFDLGRLKLLIGARRSTAEDHLWSLRDDPGYFVDTLKEFDEHDPRFPWEAGQDFWHETAGKMISDALNALFVWSVLEKLMQMMRPIEKQFAAANKDTMIMRIEDEFVWLFMIRVVGQLTQRPIYYFKRGLPVSPRMRRCYRPPHEKGLCPPSCHGNCESVWNMKSGCTQAELRVDRIFGNLTDDHNRTLHGARQLVEEAQYMLENDAGANELVDPFLSGHFADLAVLTDIQHRITSMHPWCDVWMACGMDENLLARTYFTKYINMSASLHSESMNACLAYKAFGNPLDGRFDYPVEKRRTKETVTQMRAAEMELDRFWMSIQRRMEKNGLNLEGNVEWWTEKDFNYVQYTPKWKEPAPKLLLTPSAKLDHRRGSGIENLAPTLQTPVSDNKKSELATQDRAKHKTRGQPIQTPSSSEDNSPFTPPESPVKTTDPIHLPRRVFRVMETLLPSGTGAPREISWEDFLYAFNALGLVPEKLYGSVWIFKPLPQGEGLVSVGRSIQFHEPKEVRRGSKIPSLMAKRFGRRLKRAFGWEGGMFVCA